MTDQERYEQENPLVEFPRKPGHALRGKTFDTMEDLLDDLLDKNKGVIETW